LIEEGVENQVAVVGAIGAIKMASTFAATHGPMIKGVGNVLKNVIWGEQVARKTVDPKKIDASFDNSKTFVAEIRKRFPKSYGIVAKLRQDLKLHHFDLANIIQDISLLADTTANDAHKTIRTLGLRNKLLKKGSLRASPEKDLKIWSMAIKSQVQSLEASVAKADLIIKVLSKLQKDVAKAQDNLETEIERIKKSLEASVKGLRAKFADLEQKMKSVGCVNNSGELLRAIFTFGIACAFDSPTKIKLQNVRASLREEEAILKAILKRMGYFDDLVDSAKELTHQAAGLLESTKKFRRVLADTASELKSDYTDADIAENMGDVDFANDFADELHNTLNTLLKECKRVSADCIRRKHAMERALTGLELDLGDKKEEEIVELDATDNALSKDFYGITNGCSNYFEATSAAVDAVQNAEFRNSIHALGKVKNTLLLNARESYGAVKNGLFDVLDAARDVQNDVESAQYRIETNAKKMRKYLDKRAMWKYQLKYSLNTAKNCVMDRKIVGDRVAVLEKHFSTYTHELLPAM
jgi:phage host-nuclease inhibitor protein Gam